MQLHRTDTHTHTHTQSVTTAGKQKLWEGNAAGVMSSVVCVVCYNNLALGGDIITLTPPKGHGSISYFPAVLPLPIFAKASVYVGQMCCFQISHQFQKEGSTTFQIYTKNTSR